MSAISPSCLPAGHLWSHSVRPCDWSPVYGKKEPAFVLRFSTETFLPAEFAVLLLPVHSRKFCTQNAPGSLPLQRTPGVARILFWRPQFIYRATGPDGAAEFSL